MESVLLHSCRGRMACISDTLVVFLCQELSMGAKYRNFPAVCLHFCSDLGGPLDVLGVETTILRGKKMWKMKGFRWRVWVSIIAMVSVIIFLIYWFWAIAEPFDIYQNLAIFIVAFLIAGGLLAAMWAPWGMTHSPEHQYDEQKKE